jgi:hypothetical protein
VLCYEFIEIYREMSRRRPEEVEEELKRLLRED